MANTYVAIATTTVGSGGASTIDFTSIPQTYTDLILQVSARSNESDTATSLRVYFNTDTANTSVRELRAIGGTVASYSVTYAQVGYVGASQSTSNAFGSATIYIPDYTGSKYKSSSGEVVMTSSTSTEQYAVLSSKLWSSTAAITQITLLPSSSSNAWSQYTTATLYGIKNS